MATTNEEPRFVQFCKLPNELRNKIWKLALPQKSRIVTIYQKERAHNPNPLSHSPLAATYKIPALLHTCRDSRSMVISYYDSAFARNLGGKAPVYFDWKKDCLLFADPDRIALFCGYPKGHNFHRSLAPREQMFPRPPFILALARGPEEQFPLNETWFRYLGNPKNRWYVHGHPVSKPFIEGGEVDLAFAMESVVCRLLTRPWTNIRCMKYQNLQEHLEKAYDGEVAQEVVNPFYKSFHRKPT